jgi:hypothetical protein
MIVIKKVIMKQLIVLTFCTFSLLSKSVIYSFTLPEDSNSFIYFLEKEFQKKSQITTIKTKNFNIASLTHIIINNQTSKFRFFIQKNKFYSKDIQKLALYSHIDIYVCDSINNTMIQNGSHKIVMNTMLSKEQLQKESERVLLKNTFTNISPTECVAY